MAIRNLILTLVVSLSMACGAVAQDTVFFSGFEYSEFPFVIEPGDLNGADDQVGEWSGDEFPLGVGDILVFGETIDAAGIVPSPYGGNLLVVDRPNGDGDRPNAEPNSDFTGSFFANLTESVPLLGSEVSFQVGTRRTGGNNNKDYDIIGRDADGNESFHLRVGTNNSNGERLGFITDDVVSFDLPTVVGEDGPADLDNTGGFNVDTGPGLGAEIANVMLRLGANGYVIDFSYPAENTSNFANSYVTDTLSYNGTATEIAQIEFTYEASTATGRNSGYVLDEILVTSVGDLLLGDFDGNGTIDMGDFDVLAQNFGTGTTFGEGDYDFDGNVTLADFAALKAAFNAQGQGAAAAAVPEPATFGLGGFGAMLWLLAARRRRTSLR